MRDDTQYLPTGPDLVTIPSRSLGRVGVDPYELHPEWIKHAKMKKAGNRYVPPSDEYLNRLDFAPRRVYNIGTQAWGGLEDTIGGTPAQAVTTALLRGKINISHLIDPYTAGELAENIRLAAWRIAHLNRDPDGYAYPLTLLECIAGAQSIGWVSNTYRHNNYDSIICELAKSGPVVCAFNWHDNWILGQMFRTRLTKPSSVVTGTFAAAITGYSANGLVLKVTHGDPTWPRPSFSIAEDEFVELMAEGGECFSFKRRGVAAVPVNPRRK